MFIHTRHSRDVHFATLLRAAYYTILPPQYSYVKKLRLHFGSHSLQYLNAESFLHDFLKVHPDRTPSKSVAVEVKFYKRFRRLIEKSGLQPLVFKGQKELARVITDERLLAVILPEAYDVSTKKYLLDYEKSSATKIILQSRKRPRTVNLDHTIFVWEPRFLPRAVSGTVVYVDRTHSQELYEKLKKKLMVKNRIDSRIVVRHIWKATRGFEDKYRQLDKRPSIIHARLVYDGVK